MIEGVKIKRLRVHIDERGDFREVLKLSEGLLDSIQQISLSKVKSGTIKAFHFHNAQEDIFHVIKGDIMVVLYDPRENSITKGKTEVLFLGENYESQIVLIPREVLHGYKVIGDKDAEVLYIMDKEYNPLEPDEGRISYDDPRIGFNWEGSFKRQKVLIIGASGKLGTRLMEDFSKIYDVVGTYKSNKGEELLYLDTTDKLQVKNLIEKQDPDIILIASAMTDVEACELNPDLAFSLNVESVKNIVESSKGKRIVYFSTDAVFEGLEKEFSEEDTPNPVNTYGKTKLQGEEIVKNSGNYLICRAARYYGIDKEKYKFINLVIESLKNNKDILAPVNTPGNFTFIDDVSTATLELVKKGKTGIYHVAGSGVNTLYEAAIKIAEIFEFDSSLVTPVEKDYFSKTVKRSSSILSIEKIKLEGIKMKALEEGLIRIKNYQNKFKEITKCRVCGSNRMFSYLHLGKMPLVNEFIDNNEEAEGDTFSLEMVFCEKCGFSQLKTIVDPKILFSEYVYRSSVSTSFQKHCEDFAEELNNKGVLAKGDFVVDIASNDGCLLKPFKEKGNKVLGVEPAKNLSKLSNELGIPAVNGFWEPKLAEEILKEHGNSKLITAFNVFAHVNDLHSFIKGAKILLDKEGFLIIESPHLLKLIEQKAFDTIYHEHLSYLLVKPLKYLMDLHGMKIVHVEEYEMHGGSIRIYINHKNSLTQPDESVNEIIKKEYEAGLYSKETYTKFEEEVKKIKGDLIRVLDELKKQGKTIAGYGAAAKGNILLSYSGVNTRFLDYIFDDTPEKQGKKTPKTGIPIIKGELLNEKTPDFLLILAWNFAEEIINKTKSFQERGGKYIIPIPEVKII